MVFKTLLAASVAATLPIAAFAQSQALGQPIQVEDVLTFQAGLSVDRHSNVFKLPSNVSPLATYGGTSRGETILTGLFGVKFDRDFSLQRVTLFGNVRPKKYLSYSRFDHVAYDAGLNWDWAIGRPWFGKLGVNFGQQQSSFTDVQQSERNLQRNVDLYFKAGLRLTPSWALLAGIDNSRRDSSSNAQAATDFDLLGAEIGVRYVPGTGNEFDLVYRTTDGDYPNRQVVDAQGQPLLLQNPNGVDNGYKESSLLTRLQYKPNEDTKITGELGFTRRSFDNFADRDFSGPTSKLTLDWRPGGAFFMGIDFIRDIGSQELLTANYVDVLELRLRPTFRLTGKTSIAGTLSWQNRSFDGDPGFNPAVDTQRKDRLLNLGVAMNWQYSRNILFTAGYRRESRSSNVVGSFNDNILSLGGRINL
jgi:exopolysaccharide biosynthesis operon protein EpsL